MRRLLHPCKREGLAQHILISNKPTASRDWETSSWEHMMCNRFTKDSVSQFSFGRLMFFPFPFFFSFLDISLGWVFFFLLFPFVFFELHQQTQTFVLADLTCSFVVGFLFWPDDQSKGRKIMGGIKGMNCDSKCMLVVSHTIFPDKLA